VRWFWSNGYSWGVFAQHPDTNGARIELSVLGGQLTVHTIELTGAGTAELGTRTLTKGERVETRIC
jgi:non-lysosomal glucosylceramidase